MVLRRRGAWVSVAGLLVLSLGAAILSVSTAPVHQSLGLRGSKVPSIRPISTPTEVGRFGTRPPSITVGARVPPTVLEALDLIDGTGRAVRRGSIVTVRWVEVSYASPRTVMHTTWGQAPDTFAVGRGEVIKGLDDGILGMRQGGRREIIIPPALAFRSFSDITVVLVVDLMNIGRIPPIQNPPPAPPIRASPMTANVVLRSSETPDQPAGIITGPTPPVTATADLRITIDHAIDPAPQSLVDPAVPGVRWVEMTFAVKNQESEIFHNVNGAESDSLMFSVDSADPPPEYVDTYRSIDNYTPDGSPPCNRPTTIAPRASAIYCVGFQLPVGVPLLNAVVMLSLPRAFVSGARKWLISQQSISSTPTPQTMPGPNASVTHLGGTLTMTSPSLSSAAGSPSPMVRVNIDHVIDPAQPVLGSRPPSGERFVGLGVTLTNTGAVTVPCSEGDEYELSIYWEVDADGPDSGSGYLNEGLPSGFCDNQASGPGLAPGATSTGDIILEMPVGIPVTSVFVSMGFAGTGFGPADEWLVP